MKRAQGTAGVKTMECVNPVKNKWRIRWDVTEAEEGQVTYMEEDFDHKPSPDEMKSVIIGWYNEQIDSNILSGFSYEGNAVWLSSENQFNYKAAYDLAVQTEGKTLPVMFKFGSEDSPVYRSFQTLEELTDFYTKAMAHIQKTLEMGWAKKDGVDAMVCSETI